MMHKNRRWVVTDVASAEHLAEKLTGHTWCGCNGFRLGGYLFLNDATSPDGAQEYGIVRESTGKQVESITFSWCNCEQALRHIRAVQAGERDEYAWDIPNPTIETPKAHGYCHLCR